MTPRLTDILHQIEAVLENPACRAELAALAVALAAKHTEAVVRLAEQPVAKTKALTIDEVAELLHLDKDWIYRHASKLPFAFKPSPGLWRFDEQGALAWISKGGKR